jgi:hypothetical protein
MKSKIYLGIILVQISVIVSLSFLIKQKTSNILGVSINTINPSTIQKLQSGGFKYFYEPKANTTEEVHKDWLQNVPINTINNDALNERFDYDVNKKEGVFRIITLGDSYTFGQNVSTENNWTEVLEDRLNNEKICQKVKKYEVINLGVGGYDTAYEVERYKNRGQKYEPDLVIWFVTDLYRITDKIQELANSMNIDESSNEKKGIFYEAWKLARVKLTEEYGEKGLVDYQISKFKEFRNQYYSGRPLLFMSTWGQIEQNMGRNNIYYSSVNTWSDSKDVLPDGHFNNRGHQSFAQEVIEALIKNKLIPCSP